jgi:hypothetical protein
MAYISAYIRWPVPGGPYLMEIGFTNKILVRRDGNEEA